MNWTISVTPGEASTVFLVMFTLILSGLTVYSARRRGTLDNLRFKPGQSAADVFLSAMNEVIITLRVPGDQALQAVIKSLFEFRLFIRIRRQPKAQPIARPPFSTAWRVIQLVCSPAAGQKHGQTIADARDEYFQALAVGEVWRARRARLACYLALFSVAARLLIAWAMKLLGLYKALEFILSKR